MDVTQTFLLVLAVAGLTMVMLSTRRRIRASQGQTRDRDRLANETWTAEKRATRDLEQVMLELDELSRQIHGRIDTKLARLDAALRSADERIERLSRLTRAAEGGATLDVTLDEESPGASPGSDSRDEEKRQRVTREAARGRNKSRTDSSSSGGAVGDSNRRRGRGASPPDDSEPGQRAPTAAPDARYADILLLAEEGKSAVEIARAVGRGAGEVELILALHKTQKEPSRSGRV